MFPILFKIGPISLKTYGLFVALGALAAFQILKRETTRLKLPLPLADTLLWIALIFGIAGSRLLYALTESLPLSEYWRIWDGGLSFTGGLLAASAAIVIYTKKKSLPLASVADAVALALPVGHALGRLGCLGAGCCWGKPTHLSWAITFRNPESFIPVELLGVPLHPVQLYEALGLALIFLILNSLKIRFAHRLFGLYLILYTLLRFGLEFVRGDTYHPGGSSLSLIQIMLISSALPIGLLWIYLAPGKSKT